MDRDVIEIPDSLSVLICLAAYPYTPHSSFRSAFICHQVWKDSVNKVTVFDPTPPQQPAQKVCFVNYSPNSS